MNKNYTLFPIQSKYINVWNLYKKALASFWTVEEIDLTKDKTDWESLNSNEQYFIKNILAFFAGSDGIVNENIQHRFINEIDTGLLQTAINLETLSGLYYHLFGEYFDTVTNPKMKYNLSKYN